MKKLIYFILSCTILISLIGCTDSKINENSSTNGESIGIYEEVYETIKEKSFYDVRYKWIKAFIDKDAKSCSELLHILPDEYQSERDKLYESWYEPIRTLAFGKINVEEKDDYVSFTFEITESKYDVFPVGSYTYKVREGVVSKISWEKSSDEEMNESFNDIHDLIKVISPHSFYSFNNESKKISDKGDEAIFYTLHFCHSRWFGNSAGMTEEELKEGAHEMFGIDDYIPPETVAEYREGRYLLKSHGGHSVSAKIVKTEENGSEYTCYLQLYADPMDMAKSYLVKYTLRKIDTKYRYEFEEIEIKDEGLYEPFAWVS